MRRRLLPDSHQPLFFAIASLLVFVFVTPEIANRTGAEDAFMYALEVEEFSYPQLLHPDHRLYHVLAKALYDLSGAERAFPVMLGLSLISALLALALSYILIIRLLKATPWQALTSTALIGFSNGFWRYSLEVETCSFTALTALVFIAVAFASGPTLRGCLLIALTGTLAILIHKALLPMVLGALPAWLLWHRAWRPAALYVILTTTSFLLIDSQMTTARNDAFQTYQTTRQPGEIVHYDPPPTPLRLSATQPVKAAIGFGQAFADGSAVFAIPPLRTLLTETLFPYRQLHEQSFLVRHMSLPAAISLLTLTIACGLFFAIWVLRTITTFLIQHQGWRFTRWHPTHAFFYSWAAGTILMVFLFEPDNPEMWVIAMLPIQFSLAALLKISGNSWTKPGALLVALLILTNYFGGLRLLANPDNDYHHATSHWSRTHANAEDVLVIAELRPNYERYLRYHTPVRILNVFYLPADQALDQIKTLASQAPTIVIHERIAREDLVNTPNINALRNLLAPNLHPIPDAPREFHWQAK